MKIVLSVILPVAMAYQRHNYQIPDGDEFCCDWGDSVDQGLWPGPCWSGFNYEQSWEGDELEGGRGYVNWIAFAQCEKNPECIAVSGTKHDYKLLKRITYTWDWKPKYNAWSLNRQCLEDFLAEPVHEVPTFKETLSMTKDDFIDTTIHGCCQGTYIGGGGPATLEQCENLCKGRDNCVAYSHTGEKNKYCVYYSECDTVALSCGNNGLPWRTYKRWTPWHNCHENESCYDESFSADSTHDDPNFVWYFPKGAGTAASKSWEQCQEKCESDPECTGIESFSQVGGCRGWRNNACQNPYGRDGNTVSKSCSYRRPNTPTNRCSRDQKKKKGWGQHDANGVVGFWGEIMSKLPNGYNVAVLCQDEDENKVMKPKHACDNGERLKTWVTTPADRLVTEKECIEECESRAFTGHGVEVCCSIIKKPDSDGYMCYYSSGAGLRKVPGDYDGEMLKAISCKKHIVPTDTCMGAQQQFGGSTYGKLG